MKESIFKAYDIRGKYPDEIDENGAYIIGKSYGSYLQKFLGKKKCVVGHDNRLSSPSLNEQLIKGLLESGINVIDYGLITTPMHYYTRYIEKTYGIMITASHNPKDDNGFKFSFDELANARGQMVEDFKNFTLKQEFLSGHGILEQRNIKDAYLDYMQKNVHLGPRHLRVVIDPGNGVTSTIIKSVMSLFPSIEPIYICDISDGTFPNHHPDPAVEENLQMLKDKVIECHADLGIAYDGDGDRVGFIDEQGQFLMADKIMIIAIRALINNVFNKTFLCDVKCSKSLTDEIEKLGGKVYMCRTGTSFTESATKEQNIPFGGELSGHIFFNDRDIEICSGIYDGLRIIEILSKTNESFSDLLKGINNYFSTPEIKIACPNEIKFQVVENIRQVLEQNNIKFSTIDGIRIENENSWGLIRASNTGPNLTLRFEAKTINDLNSLIKKYKDLTLKEIDKYN